MPGHHVHPVKFLNFLDEDWGMFINYKNLRVMMDCSRGSGIFKRLSRRDYFYRKGMRN